jgi:hypothetical protein
MVPKAHPTVGSKPSTAQPVKSSFADFRRKMLSQKKAVTPELPTTTVCYDAALEKAEDKTFEGGFFNITSPVRPCPSPVVQQEKGEHNIQQYLSSLLRSVSQLSIITIF